MLRYELEDFLGNSDAVINVLPSVGRGTVLADEGDLIEALNNGPIAAAVLDVTEPEPPADDSPLWTPPGCDPYATYLGHDSGG